MDRIGAVTASLFGLSFGEMAARGPFSELSEVYATASTVLAEAYPEISGDALGAIVGLYAYSVK